MLRILLLFSILFSSSTRSHTVAASTSSESIPTRWLSVEIGIIGVASSDILKSALQQAQKESFSGLVIILDTPGGTLEATRTMVKDIMSAEIPIVVWVGPNGAHAGSAGAFITLAAPIAAMAPGTNIGAAHPIQSNGKDIEEGNDLRTKVENDTLAFIESIAKLRGRNVEMATSFVATSLSVTAEEALQNKVIDQISSDVPQLLQAIDGRTITLENKAVIKVRSTGADLIKFVKNPRQKLLEILSNPNLFYLLFITGILGIGFELTHPGTLVPGVIGAISLVLALTSSSILPINFGGIVLIVASIAFMIAELFVPSFGILGIGGLLGFIFGSVLLIDSKNELGLAISWFTIAPSILMIIGFFSWMSFLIVKNQKTKAQTGLETLQGKIVSALENFTQSTGQVRVDGEIWTAKEINDAAVKKGDLLEIISTEGLTLKVLNKSI